MAEDVPAHYTSEELAERARSSQRAAQSQAAKPVDAFLVSGITLNTSASDAFTALPMTEPQMERGYQSIVNKGTLLPGSTEGDNEKFIRQILERQDPAGMIRVPYCRGTFTPETLPGGAPIADHLFVRAEVERDWSCLLPGLAQVRENRCPSIQAIPTNVEITLGESTAAQFASATQFLRSRVKEITGIFHICQLAGDSEAVAINTNDFNKLI